MNYNPIFTLRTTPLSSHHSSNDIQRYQQAKKLAYELSDEAELLRQLNACFQLRSRIDHINNKMQGISTELKGQVILICCMNIMETSKRKFSEYFEKNYWKHVQDYLISLSLQKKEEQNKGKYSINDTYRGKLKKSPINVQKKKRNIFDLLFIDRVDRVLRQIYNEINIGCSQFIAKTLTKSLVMVQRVLPRQQAQQFKANIAQILSLKNNTNRSHFQPQSSEGRYIIIDQSLSIQKNKPFKLQRQSSNISINSKYYLTKQFSIVNSIDSSRKNQQQAQSKIPQKRTSKRGSTSSNYSKRSSTLHIKSQQKAPRSSVRWNNKASIQIITNSYNRTKPLRKSNFETLRQKQSEFDKKQDSFMLKASNSIIEEEVQHEKIFDSAIKELFVNGLLKSLRRMKEFYVMFYVNSKNYMAIVEEVRECQIFYNQQGYDKQIINIRIRVINERKDLLLLSFPTQSFNRISKQASCLKLINEYAYFYVNLFNNIKVNIKDINVEMNDNNVQQKDQNKLFKIDSNDQLCLIGFIRKISTHFICICRFNKKEIQQYNNTKFIRKMLQNNSRFPKQIQAQSQSKNTDLTMDFRVQQPKKYKYGSLINYIQDDQQQQQLSLQQQNYHFKLQTNIIKQHLQISIKTLYTTKHETPEKKNRQLRRKLYNSRFGKSDEKQTQNRKIKRTIMNKNSIKLLHHMKEADLIMIEAEANRTFQNKFYRNQNEKIADKRLSYQSLLEKKIAAKKRNRNQRQFIETVKTDKGYELIMHKSKSQIEGQIYESYLGFNQRNPKRTCYFKRIKEIDFANVQNYSKPSLSIHGKPTKQIENTTLITFLKPVKIDDTFGGHAITTIKLLSNNPNTQIFIETYWQSRQKYYIFIITSQIFQKFTDINTKSFFQKPFIQHIQQPIKKKDRRTSVVASLIKQKELDPQNQQLHSNSKKLRHKTLDSFHQMNEQNESNFMVKAVPKKSNKVATISQWQTMNRGIKTIDTCSTSKMMKISGKNQIYALKKQIVSKIKNKFVKHIFFTWKNFKLYLNIKNNTPTNLQSDTFSSFQGSEIAIKNVYSKPQSPKQLLATELILIRYFQNSLANLNFFSFEGMSKVYLQHLFIKNSSDLYGRYSAFVNLRDMIQDSKFNLDYKYNNSFFCTSENKINRHSVKDIKSLFSKTSSFEDQKKLKYQEILNLSKRCSINICDIEQKKKMLRRKEFIIPNKYPNFQAPELLYKVEIREQQILLKTLQGNLKLTIDLPSLYKLIPYASQLKPSKLKKIIIQRILKDEDIIKLTTVSHQ